MYNSVGRVWVEVTMGVGVSTLEGVRGTSTFPDPVTEVQGGGECKEVGTRGKIPETTQGGRSMGLLNWGLGVLL